jgi:hypothetical protein
MDKAICIGNFRNVFFGFNYILTNKIFWNSENYYADLLPIFPDNRNNDFYGWWLMIDDWNK